MNPRNFILCESGLSVHDSYRAITMLLTLVEVSVKVAWLVGPQPHRLQAQGYHIHATYSGGSISGSGMSVHESQDCRHRAITMLLTLVEVSVLIGPR